MSLLGRIVDLLRRSTDDTVDIADYAAIDEELKKQEDKVSRDLLRVQLMRFSLNEAKMAYHCCDRDTIKKELARLKGMDNAL